MSTARRANSWREFLQRFDEITENGWPAILGINITGTVNGLQAASEALRACDGGAVVNLSSFVTHFDSPKQSNYGAAKAAVFTSHADGRVRVGVGERPG